MFKLQLPITVILKPSYADNLTFLGLITTKFGRQAKVCFEITLTYEPVSIFVVITQYFI